MGADTDITDLLTELRNGRREVLDRLFPLVYDELRRIAHRTLGPGREGETLGTTALVHEAYLKLVDQSRAEWRDRAHFYAVAAMAMRQILVDHARARRALKRGGERRRVVLDEAVLSAEEQAEAVLELDEALGKLARLDERLAGALGVTARTVRRDWVKAKGLLYEELRA